LLVFPETCRCLDLRSVLIAWKDTAEATQLDADARRLGRFSGSRG
jgi:hypothetical protein